MEEKFNIAADGMKQVDLENLQDDEKLYLYSRFKQANFGNNTTAKPGFLDFKGKAKWEAWNNLGDMSKEEAMAQYVEAAKKYLPPDVRAKL